MGGTGGGSGFEVQLLAPWTPPRDDLHCTGSIYGHVPVNPRPDETPNRWQSMEIACEGKQITVQVDGQVCCKANMDEVPSLRNAALRGYVGMQDSHTGPGEWVKFRNLRIKDLEETPEFVVNGLKSADAEARRRAREAAVRLGAPVIGPLCDLLAQEDPALLRAVEGTLFAVAAAASAPDAAERRAAASEALAAQLGADKPSRARTYAAQLLEIVGRAEAVPALAAALRDEATREAARAALQRLSGPAATQALLTALSETPAEQRPGLIQALGARRDAGAVYPLSDLAREGDEATRVAALQALGQIGSASAVRALQTGRQDPSPAVRSAAVEATLRLAAAQHPRNRPLARQLYHRAFDAAVTGPQKGAALIGLHAVGDPDLLPQLFTTLRDEDARPMAFDLLQRLEGPEVIPAVAAELKTATGPERALLLQWAAERDVSGL
jgi:HEAT repeat protein